MRLVGRERELATVADLISGLSVMDRALLIRGEAGVGKTALILAAIEMARPESALIFRATGVQAEAEMPFSSLHQLVRPLFRAITQDSTTVEPSFMQVVEAAPTAGRFDVANTVIDAIERAALRAPVLVIIDDLQWIDEASAHVLAFVARRLTDRNVSLIAAIRSGYASPWDQAGLPQLAVEPLSTAEAAELLTLSSEPLDVALRNRLLIEAGGNPLALIELPKGLTRDQRVKGLLDHDELPIPQRLEEAYISRLDSLGSNSRQLLLLCAFDRTGTVEAVKTAAGGTWWFPDLVSAHNLDLITISGPQIEFRHPLVRSAVIHASGETESRAAHQAIAATLPFGSELWAWQMVGASDAPDDDVADALESSARRSLANGGLLVALQALQQSARSSRDTHDRWRRTAYGAYIACVGGQMELARKLLQQLKADGFADLWSGPSEVSEARAYAVAATAYYEIAREGDLSSSYRLLIATLDGATNSTAEWMSEIFDLTLLVCLRSRRKDYWSDLNTVLAAMSPPAPQRVLITRDALGDPARDAHGVAERIASLRRELSNDEPWRLMWMAACAVYIDDLPSWRSELRRVVEEQEVGGSLASYMTALVLSAIDGLGSGQWVEARQWAERGLTASSQLGFFANLVSYRAILGVLHAMQGDYQKAQEYIRAAQDWALPRRIGHTEAWTYFGEAHVELAQQNYAGAYESLARISAPGSFEPYQPMALMVFMDTVAAAWKSGNETIARQHLAAGKAARIDLISPRLAFHLAACEALLAGDLGRPLYEAALTRPGVGQWPFDEGRVRMSFGEWLQSHGQHEAGRAQLMSARTIFSRLGAEPWRQRAENALSAVTAGSPASTSDALSSLTAQERRIAMLAAEGRTNKEIADLLYLSPRTVSSHLYKIFPKLGVTSRSALHVALTEP
ncbi:helix-turn-helix transcriptional regulator [Subtercola lobariae]|uniref:LuxR family transcriptional regulator n=1 Tax=Subtercola lobariae TaxID=1588641 RepID=A0A917B9F4_9MICO|nr:LuxR family transcriptional regulator [Subtercola lobariae]GGF32831.1 LuxR family transcriptional regulator [Subtercola lobariae]